MKQAYWIWIADDYEIYHLREVNLRRQEFGVDYPPFWSLSSPYAVAKFIKEIDCNGGTLSWLGTEYPLKPNEELLLPCQKQIFFG